MIIQLYEEINDDNPTAKIINLNIDESLSIGTLINEIHQITHIPKSIKLEWDDKIKHVPYMYWYGDGSLGFSYIGNLEEKICNIPKLGEKGELILWFNGEVGRVN